MFTNHRWHSQGESKTKCAQPGQSALWPVAELEKVDSQPIILLRTAANTVSRGALLDLLFLGKNITTLPIPQYDTLKETDILITS